MPGTRAGGLKAAKTNRLRHGKDFYVRVGKLGGELSIGGGFAANRELAKEAGAKGGRISRRGKAKTNPLDDITNRTYWQSFLDKLTIRK